MKWYVEEILIQLLTIIQTMAESSGYAIVINSQPYVKDHTVQEYNQNRNKSSILMLSHMPPVESLGYCILLCLKQTTALNKTILTFLGCSFLCS